MIVKIKVNEDVWQFFDGVRELNKTIHYPTGELKPAKGFSVRTDVRDFTDRPCTEDEAKGGKVELWLYGENRASDIKQVLAYRPVYILNDNGQTIERI